MSQFELDASNDIAQFIEAEIVLQKETIMELRADIEENGNSGFEKGHQLKRHIGILLLIQSAMEDFV